MLVLALACFLGCGQQWIGRSSFIHAAEARNAGAQRDTFFRITLTEESFEIVKYLEQASNDPLPVAAFGFAPHVKLGGAPRLWAALYHSVDDAGNQEIAKAVGWHRSDRNDDGTVQRDRHTGEWLWVDTWLYGSVVDADRPALADVQEILLREMTTFVRAANGGGVAIKKYSDGGQPAAFSAQAQAVLPCLTDGLYCVLGRNGPEGGSCAIARQHCPKAYEQFASSHSDWEQQLAFVSHQIPGRHPALTPSVPASRH